MLGGPRTVEIEASLKSWEHGAPGDDHRLTAGPRRHIPEATLPPNPASPVVP